MVTFDDRYAPIYITTWVGTTTLEGARWGTEKQAAVAAELVRRGRRMITISDATRVERPPPEVRKYFADSTNANTSAHGAVSISSYVVLTNPLVRGVMTAVGWMSEAARRVTTVATMRDALERALADLDAARLPRPVGLDPAGYEPPSAGLARSG